MCGSRLVREAVLQQSALSSNDAVCTPQKGSALVDAVLAAGFDDVVDALVAAATAPGVDRKVINVGSGEETSIHALISARISVTRPTPCAINSEASMAALAPAIEVAP